MAEHKHPSQTGNVKVEKVTLATGITAGSEGCREHYEERTVAIDKTEVETNELGWLEEAIVLGEALANPRSKRPWRPR